MKRLFLFLLLAGTVAAAPPASLENFKLSLNPAANGLVAYNFTNDRLEAVTTLTNLTLTGTTSLTLAASGGGTGIAADTFWAAKGDLAVATANDAASVLTVGSNNQVLTADSTQTSGVKWAATAPAGASYITQTADATLTGEQALGSLSSGIVKVTTTTGVLSSVAAPTGAVVGDADAQTLTNKRITVRLQDNNPPSSPATPASDTYDEIVYRGLTGALTINAPSGTPTAGQKLLMRIRDNGSSQTLTFQTGSSGQFRFGSDVSAPAATTAGKSLYLGFRWNDNDSRWDCIAKADGY